MMNFNERGSLGCLFSWVILMKKLNNMLCHNMSLLSLYLSNGVRTIARHLYFYREKKLIGGCKMKNITRYILCPLLIMFFLIGCSSINDSKEDIFQYKGSYIGDNSAVGNVIRYLPGNEHFERFSLETKEKPYGMILEYEDTDASLTDDTSKETIINNATYIFALVQNAEWITFNFGDQKHTVTKQALQEWYGKELVEILNEESLRKLIQGHIQDQNKVNQFFE